MDILKLWHPKGWPFILKEEVNINVNWPRPKKKKIRKLADVWIWFYAVQRYLFLIMIL